MTLNELFKNTSYDDTLFSGESKSALESQIYTKSVNGTDVPYVVCAIRDKEIRLTPEEAVRQLYIYRLIHDYGYAADRIEVEYNIHFGHEIKRADIAIMDKDHSDAPYIIVELKKPKLTEGKEQLKSYCNATGAPIGVWTNGEQISCYNRKDPNFFEEISDIPKSTQKLSDVINEQFTYEDLKRIDRISTQKKSLRSLIKEIENEVLASAGVDSFEEIFKLIFTKLYDETNCASDPNAYLQFRNSGDTDYELKDKIQALFDKAKKRWSGIFASESKILLSPTHLAICVSSLQDIKLLNNNLDVVDDAFEYLVSKSQKGEKGQYFTPRYVIDMCVKMMNPTVNDKIIDTACGSSGFTVHSIFKVWNDFRRKKGLSEVDGFAATNRTNEDEEFVKDNVFAIDFDEKTVRVARTLNLIAGDGQTNVLHLNTLDYSRWDETARQDEWSKTYGAGFLKLKELQPQGVKDYSRFQFDLVMANPPFAGDIKENTIISRYELGKNSAGKWQSKVSRDVLFIERNLNFLKPGGRMAIVLPQGRFNNSSDKYIREYITNRCRILAVVGLHGNVFKPHTGTKTSVLFVQKWDDVLCPRKDDYPIFFATMQKPSKDNSGDKIYVKDPITGENVLDSHGHLIVDHDLYSHEGLTPDGIAEAFVEFAKKEGLSFFSISPSVEPFNKTKYKALMDGLEITERFLSSLERTKRIDAEFYNKENVAVDSVLSLWNKKSITDCFHVSDGNHTSIADNFCANGVPYYRGQDIHHLFIENSTPLMIDQDTFNKPQMLRSHLKKGDVLMSIVGTVGESAIVTTDNPATCSCKLSIMRTKNNGILPEVLLVYIKTKYGQVQIQKFKRGAVQTGLLLEDLDQIFIPTFGAEFQQKVRQLTNQIYECEQQSKTSYEEAQNYLNNEIGVSVDVSKGTITKKLLSTSFKTSGRLDAEYYQPKYDAYAAMIFSSPNGFTYVKNKFSLIKAKCDRSKETYRYIEIGDVNVNNGSASSNLVATKDLPDNAKTMTKVGDVLISTVRPNRGATVILETDDNLVSGAFTVLRQSSDYPKEILQVLLRSDLYKDWLLRFNVGTSYPVIKDDDILNIPIPVVSQMVQSAIVEKVREATALRNKSKKLLDSAKRAVEVAIEQGEDAAIAWLGENFLEKGVDNGGK